MPFKPAVAHVRRTGATTRTPDASPSVHVRNTRPSSSAAITSPRRSDVGPKAALTMAATNAQATRATTSNTRSSSPRPPVRRRNTRAAITTASVFPTVWPSDGPERRRIVPEQEIADHDARPQPNAVQEQHGEAQRPQAATGPPPHRRDMRARGRSVPPGNSPRRPAQRNLRRARHRRAGSPATPRSICARRGGAGPRQ